MKELPSMRHEGLRVSDVHVSAKEQTETKRGMIKTRTPLLTEKFHYSFPDSYHSASGEELTHTYENVGWQEYHLKMYEHETQQNYFHRTIHTHVPRSLRPVEQG